MLFHSTELLSTVMAYENNTPEEHQQFIYQAIEELNQLSEDVTTNDVIIQQFKCLVKIALFISHSRSHSIRTSQIKDDFSRQTVELLVDNNIFLTDKDSSKALIFSPRLDKAGNLADWTKDNKLVLCSERLHLVTDDPIANERPRGKPRGIRRGATAPLLVPYLDPLHSVQRLSSPRVHLPSKHNIHQTKTPRPIILSLIVETA